MKIHPLFYDIFLFLLFQVLFKDWVKIKIFFNPLYESSGRGKMLQ